MTKINLPYLFIPKAKGRQYYYYRRNSQRIAIKGIEGQKLTPDDPGFVLAWQAIHNTFSDVRPVGPGAGTLAHVIEDYLGSPEYRQLSGRSQKDYRYYLDILKVQHGNLSIRTMPKEFVRGLRNKFAETPRKANYLVAVLRVVLSFAEEQPRKFNLPVAWVNPARRQKMLKTGAGHRPWEEHEITAFREKWGPRTVERVAFEILLNTGQRGGDVISISRQQIKRDGSLWVPQEKTGERVEIPMSKDLWAVLDPWLKASVRTAVLTTSSGRVFKVDNFRRLMRDAYNAAGLPETCTTHGLRYTAATILRELDCDWETIADITGHRTAEMVRKYTEKKRRTRVAITRLNGAREA